MTFSYLQICARKTFTLFQGISEQYSASQEDSRIEKGIPLIENRSTDASNISKGQKYLSVFFINSLLSCEVVT